MNEVKTFLDRVADRQNCFLFFGDRLYSVNGNSNSPDQISVGDFFMTLTPSLPFSSFESLDDKVYSKQILEDCKQFVKSTVDLELQAEQEASEEKNRIKALEFIVYDFFPLLVSKKYEDVDHVAEMLFQDSLEGDGSGLFDRARAELQLKLDRDFGTETELKEDPSERVRKNVLEREKAKVKTSSLFDRRYSPADLGLTQDLTPSITGEITGFQPLYTINGQIYSLRMVERDTESQLVVRINGRKFVPEASRTNVSKVRDELRERKKQLSRIYALEQSKGDFDIIRDAIFANDKKQRQMVQLAKLKDYDLDNCGFVLKNGQYYVYSRIPKFATQDGRDQNKFWPFPSVKVAIHIGYDRGAAYTYEAPIVIDPMEFHPCLRDKKSGFCDICNLNRSPSSYENTPRDMLRKLSDAVNVIMHPLNKPSLDSHSGHSYFGVTLNEILKQGHLSRSEAEKQGYFIAEVIENSGKIELSKTGGKK